ncbi:MAG: alanyl-tRNA editing protein [Oscillospiraceae bacterium]|nr:alanyl-tRNA editing protein [Oscillospiraceae bacterium]
METTKLYYEDAYCKTFTAVVLDCQPHKEGFQTVLDRTAFYPEGGGQPGDRGTLGGVSVLDTHEKDGIVLHYTAAPLEPGAVVEGTIDWERRFDLTQQHSGEHIVSGIVHAWHGYDNVGFHMGSGVVTIDFNGTLDMDQLQAVEAEANRQIWLDRETQIYCPDREALARLDYRSKKELTGTVRIVTIPGADTCACCGTHVRRTGEIGLVKLLSCQTFREGVRVEMVCGKRAFDLLSRSREQNDRISVLLSAKPEETAAAVARLMDEYQRVKSRIYAMEEEHFSQEAARLAGTGDVLLFEPGLEADALRRLGVAVMERCGGRCAAFSGSDGLGYKYVLGQAGGDLRALTKELNARLHGRGGGKPHFVQGSVQAARQEIETFFATFS